MRRLLAAVVLFFASAAGISQAQAQSLSASPSSLYTGQSVSATWSGIASPSSVDWIGLYVAGAADNAFVAYVYTGGGASGSKSVTVPVNAAAGTYELRLFANNGYTLLATSGAITVQTPPAATLSASPSSVYSSQPVTATWGAIFQPSATDWVGLYAAGAADNAFVAFIYTNGNASGSAGLTVPANAAAGTYELRLFSNNGYSKLATSGAITVQTPPPASLSRSPASVYSSQSVTATWATIFAPTSTDWIGIYPVGAADNAFVAFIFTNGSASGSAGITVPANAAAGTYELRLFYNNGYSKLATSGTITVQTPPPATLSASPSSVLPGGNVTATWGSIFAPSATDWIGLYAPGATDNAFISWRYTTGTAAGNVPFAIAAGVANGTYELRLFSANSFTRIATSAHLSVGATQAALYFIHPDHLGTPRIVADDAGTAVWKWDQREPFGNDVPNQDPGNTGTTFDLPIRFPGQYQDSETNVRFNNFRDYNSETGRFVQSDPIGLAGGINTYSYARNRSISSIDPLGLYESSPVLRGLVPGQVAWDNAVTAWESGRYGWAATHATAMVAEQLAFLATFGLWQAPRAIAPCFVPSVSTATARSPIVDRTGAEKQRDVLNALQKEFASARPSNADEALQLVTRAASSVNLETARNIIQTPGGYELVNAGNVVTSISATGEIVVQKGTAILLHLP